SAVMSDASSAVTYMSVYTDSEPWRYYREDSDETGPPGVIVYEYDGPPIQPVAPPSPDYVPGLEHPPSPIEIPYVPEPEYPEYLAPSDDEAPLEDQPLPTDASPIAASADYARKTVRPEPPMSASMEACIARHAALLSPPLLVPSLPLPLPSPLTTSPTDTGAPLGYRARACLTAPTPGFKIKESSAAVWSLTLGDAGLSRQDMGLLTLEKMMRIAPTTLEGVNERVTELDTTVRQRTDEFEAWTFSMDRSSAIAAHVRTLETQVAALITQTMSLQTQLTTTLGCIEVLEARDLEPQEGPAEAGSSC
nr:hypothetical protein [Tanacetum cinerariifolium]